MELIEQSLLAGGGISSMFRYEVVVSAYNCKWKHFFVRWRRWPKSKRKRIIMKWRKKYGAVYDKKCVQDQAHIVFGKLVMCPHVAEMFKKASQ